jgi:NADPH2:quinone reductase
MPVPGREEVLIRHTAIGLNYIDVYHRNGLYPVAKGLPFTPGVEGVGVVEAVGEAVRDFVPGERVAYCKGGIGAYSQYRVLRQDCLIKLPEDMADPYVAAALLKGETAHFLLRRTFNVQEGMAILVYAAAGGVGQFLCQWGQALGATVIGVVGSEEKLRFASENGCAHALLWGRDPIAERVREITGGRGVNAVYDSVGKDTFYTSLDCLMTFGLMVSFGQSSGQVPPFEPRLLMEKGSLFFTRPTLFDYKNAYEEYLLGAAELFELIRRGHIRVHIGQSYYLEDAATAHRDLEARRTHHSTILLPA